MGVLGGGIESFRVDRIGLALEMAPRREEM